MFKVAENEKREPWGTYIYRDLKAKLVKKAESEKIGLTDALEQAVVGWVGEEGDSSPLNRLKPSDRVLLEALARGLALKEDRALRLLSFVKDYADARWTEEPAKPETTGKGANDKRATHGR